MWNVWVTTRPRAGVLLTDFVRTVRIRSFLEEEPHKTRISISSSDHERCPARLPSGDRDDDGYQMAASPSTPVDEVLINCLVPTPESVSRDRTASLRGSKKMPAQAIPPHRPHLDSKSCALLNIFH